MWRYCEKNSDVIWYCESQCERNSFHIVTHIVRRLWENCEWRWKPFLSIICMIIKYRKINHQSYLSRYVEISLPNDYQCDTQCQWNWVNEPLILFYFTLCLNTYTAKIPYAICVYAFNTYAERITANELYARIPIASELNAQIQDSP